MNPRQSERNARRRATYWLAKAQAAWDAGQQEKAGDYAAIAASHMQEESR